MSDGLATAIVLWAVIGLWCMGIGLSTVYGSPAFREDQRKGAIIFWVGLLLPVAAVLGVVALIVWLIAELVFLLRLALGKE